MNPQYYGAAAEYNKPTGGFRPNKRLFVMLGLIVGLLLVIGIGFTLISNLSRGPVDDFTTLISRETSLQDLMQKQQSAIRNGDLRKINSEGNILLLSDINALNAGFTTTFGEGSVPEDGFPPEADDTSETTLKNATASGSFDRTYVGLLREKIASAYQQADKVAAALNDGEPKTAIEATMTNLDSIDKQLVALGL